MKGPSAPLSAEATSSKPGMPTQVWGQRRHSRSGPDHRAADAGEVERTTRITKGCWALSKKLA